MPVFDTEHPSTLHAAVHQLPCQQQGAQLQHNPGMMFTL
jgi:hypothetical protein